jgi:hypothetical protein
MRIDALAEFVLVASREPEPAALRVATQRVPYVRAGELRLKTLAPGLRRLGRAAQCEQARQVTESSLALLVLACAALEPKYRRGVRACHLARQLSEWGAWGPWLGHRSAAGVARFLVANGGRPCGADGPVAGWGLVKRDGTDHVRWATAWLG